MALHGVKVLDLTHVIAGPFCTKCLRDLGARVIKVENPAQGGDLVRRLLPRNDKENFSGYFETVNGGKESIGLRLSPKVKGSEEDRDLFEAILSQADVLVENFRPGVLAEWGYSWEWLHEHYPKLIVAHVSGFGQDGPYWSRKAVDTIVQGMSGFIQSTGHSDKPVKVGTTISDLTAGLYCVTGITSALHARHRTGEGVRVDVSMFDTSFSFHAREFVHFQTDGTEPDRFGNSTGIGVYPFDVFECKGGLSFSVAPVKDGGFAGFCRSIHAEHLPKDPRYADRPSRWENRKALREDILAITKQMDREEVLRNLDKLQGSEAFPFGPVNTFKDLQQEPQLLARGMIQPRRQGSVNVIGNPIKVNSPVLDKILAEMGDPHDAPTVGEHGPSLRREFSHLTKIRSRM